MNFKDFADRALCILFPRRCRYCGEVIEPREMLCDGCKKNLPRITEPVCLLCGCSRADCVCKSKKNFYDAVTAPFYYEGAIVKAIDRMKFHDKAFMADVLGEDMLKTVNAVYSDKHFDLVCFVPFSKTDKKSREFNHSELLAHKIADGLKLKCADIIEKIYDVPTQHSLGSEERKGNVFGIFDVTDAERVKDKTVLLVDDIKTTGATLNECAKMLKLSGAKEVLCVTFAVTKKRKKAKKVDSLR